MIARSVGSLLAAGLSRALFRRRGRRSEHGRHRRRRIGCGERGAARPTGYKSSRELARRPAGPASCRRCARAWPRSRRARRRLNSSCSPTPTSPMRRTCSARLVTIARAKNSVLTSLMVKLRCESAAERWLAPAFVFFFQMLYPFAWVNDPRKTTAAAAGGCMLVRREALHAAGGLEAVRGALIDDCALGALMKGQGPIWLGLTESVDSLRAYPTFADFRRMVARSAFAELRYSPLRLAGAIGGMALVYLAPPLFAIFARGAAQACRRARLGDDGGRARADAAALRSRRLSAASPCLRSPPPMSPSPSIPRTNIGGGEAATGKDDSRRRCGRQGARDDGERGPLGQGPPGREFSRRLVVAQRAATRSDPRLLSFRARGRRRRRSSEL